MGALGPQASRRLRRHQPEDAARSLRTRWDALLDAETCNHADVKAALARVLHLRAHWRDGVRRYVASMYEMEPEVWKRVAQFIDTGSQAR